MDLAILLRRTPEEVETMPHLDSVLLLERNYEHETADFKTQARLHGFNVK
jgi:hypothetical protein